MGNRKNRNTQASKPAVAPTEVVDPPVANDVEAPVDETAPATDMSEAPEETSEDVEEQAPESADEESPADDAEVADDEVAEKQADPRVFWVEGYGNVHAKSQAEAEKKAKKIVEDRRK